MTAETNVQPPAPRTHRPTEDGVSPHSLFGVGRSTLDARPYSAPLRDRLATLRRFRHALATRAGELAATLTRAHPLRTETAETLAAEILPLADACRFLEREAPRLLKPRRLGARGRPAWLWGTTARIEREPLGVVLVIAPSNYPLFLPGVQTIQALAAGNAVLLKPGRGGTAAANALASLLHDAGLPDRALRILDESPEAAESAIEAGVDKVLLTGSARTGRAVLEDCARHLTPAVMELSGCDAAFVLPSAGLDLTADALAFGTRFNAGATCIAPRRVFVHASVAARLESLLLERLAACGPLPVDPAAADRAFDLADRATAHGARRLAGDRTAPRGMTPLLLTDVAPNSPLLQADLFAPVLSLVRVASMDDALAADRRCPYALGASVFGDPAAPGEATRFAAKIDAGSVTINDLIAPTADPRLPFPARHRSGFGATRGSEGLLELTRLKVVTHTRGKARPQHAPLTADHAAAATAYLRLAHSGPVRDRLRGLRDLLRVLPRLRPSNVEHPTSHPSDRSEAHP